MARLGSGKRVGDLVENGVGDLLRRAVQGVRTAQQYEFLPRAAFAQLPARGVEAHGPLFEPVPVHEFARLRGDLPQPRDARAALLGGGCGSEVETDVGHGPDAGAAPHPGALGIEFLDGAGQAAAAGGGKPHRVAGFKANLRVLDADGRGAVRAPLTAKEFSPVDVGHFPHVSRRDFGICGKCNRP